MMNSDYEFLRDPPFNLMLYRTLCFDDYSLKFLNIKEHEFEFIDTFCRDSAHFYPEAPDPMEFLTYYAQVQFYEYGDIKVWHRIAAEDEFEVIFEFPEVYELAA